MEPMIYCSTYLQLVNEKNPKPNPYPIPQHKLNPKLPFLFLVSCFLQLLEALDALKGLSILHTHIKPDNIMFNKHNQPLRVKLIDFSEAIPASQVQPGMELQLM